MIFILLAIVGLLAGVFSGMFGIGGGLLIVPALMYIARFPPHVAMATSIVALLLPVGSLAAWEYYSSGRLTNQHIVYGLLIGVMLFIGAYFGAKISLSLNDAALKKAFAVFLLFAAILTWFKA
jgi:uncharacterized membrane protein YfcA